MTIRQITSSVCKSALLCAAVAASIAANADTQRPTLYLGASQLRGSQERSVGGQTGFVGIASIPSSTSASLAPGIGTNSYDLYVSRSSSNGGSFTTFGLMLTERIPLGVMRDDENVDKVPYFGFGLGFGVTQATVKGTVGGAPVSFSKQVSSRLIRLCVGQNFGKKTSVEFGYSLTPGVGALVPNHVSLSVGIKL
ncbi:MAG: outer membrane beta-barrel protein [Armatimonadota bacterium]